MSRLLFFTQEAFRALRRNAAPSVAAIVTTVVTVILLGVLIPVLQTTQAKSDQVRSQLEIQVAIFDEATPAEIGALKTKLEQIPHVATVTFISKAEALADPQEPAQGQDDRRSSCTPTRCRPASKSRPTTPPTSVRFGPRSSPRGPNGKPRPISPIVQNIFDRQQAAQQIAQVTSALKIVLTVITALLIAASLLLVGNTIRLSIYTRRREVEVMRLVGATRWFIRWPFMIEGVVVGFAGGLLAILILWLGKITIVDPLSKTFSFLAAQNNSTLSFPALVAILFAAAVLVSAIGSGVTLRRFLKV